MKKLDRLEKVKRILVKYKKCRDDDNLLIIKYIVVNEEKLKFTDFASIIRKRALIQQFNPELRGDKYKARQNHAKTIKQKLRSQEKPVNLLKEYEPIDIVVVGKEPKRTLYNLFGLLS